jgi:hypothetical protein
MSYQEQKRYRKGEMEVTCEDFKSYKGCGQKILLKKTNEPKEDGSGMKWKKFELDGVTPHSHSGSGTSTYGEGGAVVRQQQQSLQQQEQQRSSSPPAPQNDFKFQALEQHIGMLQKETEKISKQSLEIDSLKVRLARIEKHLKLGSTKESDDLTELGVSKETRMDAGKVEENKWSKTYDSDY